MTETEVLDALPVMEETALEWPELFPICPCGCRSLPFKYAPYPDEPPYTKELIDSEAEIFAGITNEIEAERFMIRIRAWENPEVPEWFWPVHLKTKEQRALLCNMRHIGMLFPWVTHDPNLVRLVRDAERGEDLGRKIMNMIGHASSGKTHFMVLDAVRMIDIFPENSECFVASPYKTASQYLLWATFISMVDRLKEHGYEMYRKGNVISLYSGVWEGPGTITLVAFHAVSVIRGKKLLDPDIGYLGIYLDEAGEFPSTEVLMHILANLKSQRNLRVRTGTNFRNITGLDGKFNQPETIPWGDLKRNASYFWLAVNGGFTVRMRAMMSPNMILKLDLYAYLLRQEEHEDLLRYGKDSPYYLAQGDAFPSLTSVNRVLISDAEIQGGHTYTDVDLVDMVFFAFLDPSFTLHGDAAIITFVALGREKTTGDQKIRIMEVDELKIGEATWTPELIEIAKTLRTGGKDIPARLKPTHEVGLDMTAFDMAAVLAGAWLMERNIPFGNFAFDDSLRGRLTASMTFFLGSGVEPIHYGEDPTNKMTFPPEFKWVEEKTNNVKRRARKRMRADELFVNRVAQMWMTTVGMIVNGYVRNGLVAEKAMEQLQARLKAEIARTQVKGKTPKKGVEGKDEYKDRNRQESPDHGDSLCGAVWLAVDRKMAPEEDSSAASARGGRAAAAALIATGERRTPRIPRLSR